MYSAAGASFLLALTCVQLAPLQAERLEWALLCSIVSTGLWLAAGGMYEGAILMGKSSHDFIASATGQVWVSGACVLGGITLITSLGLLLHWVLPLAAWALEIAIGFYVLFTAAANPMSSGSGRRTPTRHSIRSVEHYPRIKPFLERWGYVWGYC